MGSHFSSSETAIRPSERYAEEFLGNIDRHAASVLNGAAQAVQAVLDRRAAMDGAGKTAETLYVYLGEVHPCVAHKVAAVKIIDSLRRIDPALPVSFELSHNLFERYYSPVFNKAGGFDAPLTARMRARDRNGIFSLQTVLGCRLFLIGDMSTIALYDYLRRNSVAVRFTDVAYRADDDSYLDTGDLSTMKSVKACKLDLRDIFFNTKDGMLVRNHHMTEGMMSLARDQGSRIVVHYGGTGHLAGDVDEGEDSAARSFAAEGRRRGLSFMVVPMLSPLFDRARFPSDHGVQCDEMHYVEGLPEVTAAYHPGGRGRVMLDDRGRAVAPDLRDALSEEVCLNALLQGIGLGGYMLSVAQRRVMSLSLKQGLARRFVKWQQEDAAGRGFERWGAGADSALSVRPG